MQTDEEWEEDEFGRGEQGVPISHLLGESSYKGIHNAQQTQETIISVYQDVKM